MATIRGMAKQHCGVAPDCNNQKNCDCVCAPCNVAARLQLIAYVENGWKERHEKSKAEYEEGVSQEIVPKGKGLI